MAQGVQIRSADAARHRSGHHLARERCRIVHLVDHQLTIAHHCCSHRASCSGGSWSAATGPQPILGW